MPPGNENGLEAVAFPRLRVVVGVLTRLLLEAASVSANVDTAGSTFGFRTFLALQAQPVDSSFCKRSAFRRLLGYTTCSLFEVNVCIELSENDDNDNDNRNCRR